MPLERVTKNKQINKGNFKYLSARSYKKLNTDSFIHDLKQAEWDKLDNTTNECCLGSVYQSV